MSNALFLSGLASFSLLLLLQRPFVHPSQPNISNRIEVVSTKDSVIRSHIKGIEREIRELKRIERKRCAIESDDSIEVGEILAHKSVRHFH